MEINKVYNEDCLIGMKEIPNESIDLIVTDPPYGMNYQSGRRKNKYINIANDNNLNWLDGYFNECNRILKNNSAIYSFCSWHHIDIFKSTFEKYFDLKNILVWVKNNHGSGDLMAQYAPQYEFILYGNKGRSEFRMGRFSDVVNANKTNNNWHPTQKPINLIEWIIKNSSNEGDVVLDTFMGSGTTAVACVNTKRNFVGFELDKGYYDIANKRIKDAQSQLRLF